MLVYAFAPCGMNANSNFRDMLLWRIQVRL